MRTAALVTLLLLAACGGKQHTPEPLPQPGPGDAVPAGVDLSGNWFLVEDNAMPAGGPARGGPGGPGGGGGMPGGGGRGGPPRTPVDSAGGEAGGPRGAPPAMPVPDAPPPTGAAADVALLERAPLRIVLGQSDTALSIRRNDGMLIVLPFDGREVVVERPDHRGQLHISGRWRARRFEALALISSDLVFVESYEVSGDGSRLTVRARLHGDRVQREVGELKRVYQRGNR